MAKIQKLSGLVQKLNRRMQKAAENEASVSVGYTARYAIFVHENMEMKLEGKPRPSGLGVYWGPAGSSKFLEGPAREYRPQMAGIVSKSLRSKQPMGQALLTAGKFLQRVSQQRVPVEYGLLRASAYTRLNQ
jgi:hypothetical protein